MKLSKSIGEKAIHGITLCADDYGLAPGVSLGIRQLIEMRRLSAVSCMVRFPEFAEDGPLLQPYFGLIDIGLHFDLTSNASLAAVARGAYLRMLDLSKLAEELARQLESFHRAIGRTPDYIDGHRHIHILPGVRETVVEAAQRIGAWVRSTVDPIDASLAMRPSPVEAAFLSLSSRRLKRLADAANVVTNRSFRGARTFREVAPYRDLFRAIIWNAPTGCLIMCHPGHVDNILRQRDGVLDPREGEWSYLVGSCFPQDLAEAGLTLSRMREALGIA